MYSSDCIVDDPIRVLCAPSKQERLDPAVQPFDTTLNSGRETSVKKQNKGKKKKKTWNPPDVRDRRAQRKNWSDKRKDCTGDMCLWRARRLGLHSKTSNQERCLFSHACPCSQQSLSSQQLFQWGRWALPTLHLRAVNKLCWGGLDDVCVRNKIILKPILMVPLRLLRVLSQQILTGVKLCRHWRQASWLLQMYAASGCIGPLVFASLIRGVDSAPLVWIMSFDGFRFFSVRTNQGLKFPIGAFKN